jgi:DNA repair exonuclease SbcCD ATPase subunit
MIDNMNSPLLPELKQKDFELEMKDKLIKEQNNELEQQQTLISNLKDELQRLKTETDVKLELQEKMIEKLKIELEVYITEIKKKMNDCKKKQESHSDNPIQRNSKITSTVEMFSNQEKIPTPLHPH